VNSKGRIERIINNDQWLKQKARKRKIRGVRYFMTSIFWIVFRAGIFFITGIPVSRCSRSMYYYSPIVIRRVLTSALVLPSREPRRSDFPNRSTRRHVFWQRLRSASRDYSKSATFVRSSISSAIVSKASED